MSRKSLYKAATDFEDEEMIVNLIGLPDRSEDAEARRERVGKLVTKIMLLGQTRGRVRREDLDEEKNAA